MLFDSVLFYPGVYFSASTQLLTIIRFYVLTCTACFYALQAEYMCSTAPSLTEQYEYAHEHGMKWLVIISEAALSLTGKVKVTSFPVLCTHVCGFHWSGILDTGHKWNGYSTFENDIWSRCVLLFSSTYRVNSFLYSGSIL